MPSGSKHADKVGKFSARGRSRMRMADKPLPLLAVLFSKLRYSQSLDLQCPLLGLPSFTGPIRWPRSKNST